MTTTTKCECNLKRYDQICGISIPATICGIQIHSLLSPFERFFFHSSLNCPAYKAVVSTREKTWKINFSQMLTQQWANKAIIIDLNRSCSWHFIKLSQNSIEPFRSKWIHCNSENRGMKVNLGWTQGCVIHILWIFLYQNE